MNKCYSAGKDIGFLLLQKRASLRSKLRSNDFLSLCLIKAVARSSYPGRSEEDAILLRHQPSPSPRGLLFLLPLDVKSADCDVQRARGSRFQEIRRLNIRKG